MLGRASDQPSSIDDPVDAAACEAALEADEAFARLRGHLGSSFNARGEREAVR